SAIMTTIQHPNEKESNTIRDRIAQSEPKTLRTFTPSQAILARSAGIYHWTPEGRRLYDFTSGVLVSNLGHNPVSWTQRFFQYMGWPLSIEKAALPQLPPAPGYFSALPMTAYNAITPVEAEACRRILALLQGCPGGSRLEQVLWAASGSEAIQKALWASMARDRDRPMILATRYGFHGKKGLAGAVTGCETDHERDPRVRFVSFPMAECRHVNLRNTPCDLGPYRRELAAVWGQFGRKIGTFITEPY